MSSMMLLLAAMLYRFCFAWGDGIVITKAQTRGTAMIGGENKSRRQV